MRTFAHKVRKNIIGDREYYDFANITLPAIPGVVVDGDRSETDPNLPSAKRKLREVRGAALAAKMKVRIAMFRKALIEVSQEREE